MSINRRRFCAALPAPLVGLALPHQGLAQEAFPSKSLKIVCPFAPGGGSDFIARVASNVLNDRLGQPVVVENRPGAGGTLGTEYALRSAADGYTVLITTNTTHAANQHLYKKLPYDAVKDFAPVAGLGKGGQVLVVRADAPYKNVGDLLAAAKKQPGKLSFGSGSSSSRVAGEMLKQLAGVDLMHVPYKSNPLAITDLLGGQIDLMITDTSTGVPQVKSGKLRALGYSTTKRSPQLPEVPTLEEAGVKGYDMGYWFAAYAPAGTPEAVVARLNRLLSDAVHSAGAKSFFEMSGSEGWTATPQELAAFQAGETQKWGQVIKAAGIQPE
ncbi:MAG TPA: ABC transporter substrate-binding protein [Delftia acidovorans]|nr:ABC transporter substrate-binding protein [Delftia acidovorans]